jgi:hypothetical protein
MLVLLSCLSFLFVAIVTAFTSDILWLRAVAWASVGLFAVAVGGIHVVVRKVNK